MARFLPDAGLLIQHIPRCGGSFVERALDELKIPYVRWLEKQPDRLPRKHSLLEHYRREPMREVRAVACWVREPVAYYKSVWCWLTQAGERGRRKLLTKWSWHPHASAARLYAPDFGRWVWLVLDREPAWATRIFESYTGPEGGEFCQFVGRCETIAEDLPELLDRVGFVADQQVVQNIPRQNESKVPKPEIGRWAEDKIRESERVAIRRWYGAEADRRSYGEWT